MLSVSDLFKNKFLYITWLKIDLSIDFCMRQIQTNDAR